MRKDRFYKGQIGWDEFISHPLLDGAMYWAEHSSHTFGRLVPVSTYYETHPEYYSLVDGKRIRKEGQLCMTNADVADITSQWAIDRLNQDPKARLVSISQGDWGGFCQCESCNTSRQQYEDIRGYSLNYSSALVPFVSKVAQKVSATHPDALVTTLAYQFTRIASTDMKIPDNMVVRYCPIEVCALHAMDDTAKCPWHQKNYEGTSFVNELKTWLKVSPNVWIWYYAHNRGGSLQPSPFLGTASRNIKMFQRMGVKGVQVQSIISPTRWYSPFEDLKSYIMAKLTWEPDYNVKQGVTEFCNAYYGPAAPIIDRYVWALHDDDIYADSTAAFLARLPGTHMLHGQITPIKTEYLHEFDAWFDAAEKKVADDPTLLHRVRVVRMTLQYSLMVHGKRDDPIREKAIAAFFPFAEKIGITDENYEEQHGLRDTATDKVVSLSEFKKIMKNR
jgi:hypothetical protein